MSSSKKKCIKTISALMYILKPNLNSKIWFTVPLLGPPLNLILTLFGMKHQHPFLLIVFSVVSVFIITWIWIHYAKEVAEFRQTKYLLWEELYL
ncbi:hypothetical protein [Bacillus salipaludis]|uniref:Uncharacterized protein n=1 Tax=Bacillus salipaludis TaxID=2547811 RepID=A0AA90TWN2_9BACI|nr:hypothetical protein [Bacillus salipaludis]MDQ6600826.1 hypothetical protein [Bacillus salipaludis]